MSPINRNYMFKMSAMDEEDAFDPADLSPEELYSIGREKEKFVRDYKSYYDDIKTDTKLHKEDW